MSEMIQQSQLRNDNASVMRRVATGESFIVTVNGRPVADVIPHRRSSRQQRFVTVAELAEALATTPRPDPAAWRADLATADGVFSPDSPTDPFTPEHR